MTLSRTKSIYEFSNLLWGGHLASLAPSNVCSSLTHFCPSIGDVISDTAKGFFVFAHKIFSKTIKSISSHTYPKIGIWFSFSPSIACCDVQAIVFENTKNNIKSEYEER